MPEKTSIRLDALNIRLTGQDPAAASALVRELPGALKRALTSGPRANPASLSGTVAAQVVDRLQARLRQRKV